MYHYITVDENGNITHIVYMANGINDIEYLGWNREEKEKSGAFVESLPEDYADGKYLYIDGKFVLNPDYVPPDDISDTEVLNILLGVDK